MIDSEAHHSLTANPGLQGGKALVLGSGTSAFLSVVRSLGRKGVEVHVGGCCAGAPELYSRYIKTVHALPPYGNDDAWLRAMRQLLDREAFNIVMPTNEQSARPLHIHRDALGQTSRLCLMSRASFEIVFDKQKSNALAAELGIRVPRSRIVSTLEELLSCGTEFGYPLVLKPISSYRDQNLVERRNVAKAYTIEELHRLGGSSLVFGPILVQENFIGIGVGVELLAVDGVILVAFQHERVHQPPRGGASSYRRSVPLRPVLLDASAKLVERLGYTGVMMVEFLWNDLNQDWRFVEINARYWGSLPLAIACGADFPWFQYQAVVNGQREFPTNYRQGVYCRNLIGDLRWFVENLNARRSDPTLATVPPLKIVGELKNVVTFRDRSDTFVWDDPRPGIAEIAHYVSRLAGRVRRRWKVRCLRLPGIRHRLRSRARAAIRQAISILFVCRGNICRSPFAEHFARRLFPSDTRIASSGLYPLSGRPSPTAAITAAQEWNIDLSAHCSRILTVRDLDEASIVFSFDEELQEEMQARYPHARHKIFRFAAVDCDRSLEVPDPWGRPVEDFARCYQQIASVCEQAAFAQVN